MKMWILDLVLVFFLSSFMAGIIIPKILLIAFRKKLFDVPNERKIHTAAVPRLGGLAFSPVMIFSLSFVIGLNAVMGNIQAINLELTGEMTLGLCGLLLLYIVGMADDLIGVRYSAKFVIQILCSIMLVVGGITLNNLNGLLGIYELPYAVSCFLTILVVVFFTNAINLIDGVDGLASGLSIAASLFYTFIFINSGNYIYAAISSATLGVLIPFYYYNVFGNANKGKKIFMGDTGSLTLGYTLSFLSLKISSGLEYSQIQEFNPFVLAFTPLLIPCLDVLRVFFRRVRHHKSPFLPDRTHIHHKLIALGLSPRVTMVTVVSISILLTGLNIIISKYININILLILNICAWILINIWMTKLIKKRNIDCDFNK